MTISLCDTKKLLRSLPILLPAFGIGCATAPVGLTPAGNDEEAAFVLVAEAKSLDRVYLDSNAEADCADPDTICHEELGYRAQFDVRGSRLLQGAVDDRVLEGDIAGLDREDITARRFLLIGRDRAGDANAHVDIVAPVNSIACVPASFTQSLPYQEEIESVLSFIGSYEALDTKTEDLRCVGF